MGNIWPSRNWVDKQSVEYWQLNEISANIDFLMRPPICIGNMSAAVNIPPDGQWVCMNWDVQVYDSDEMSDGGTRITFNTPGLYIVRYRIAWPGPSTVDLRTSRDKITMGAAIGLNRSGQFTTGSSGTLATDIISWEIDDFNAVSYFPYSAGPDTETGHQPPDTGYGMRNTCVARVRVKAGDYVEAFAAEVNVRKPTNGVLVAGKGINADINAGGGSSSKDAVFSARWLSM